jgi:phage-related protein
MATQTFTWIPLIGPTGSAKLRTRKAQYGEGYRQVLRDGPNNKVQSWPFTFRGKGADMQAIVDFLDARGGDESFYFTPPLGVQGYFKCEEYTMVPEGNGVFTVSATFEQDFKP